jgi:16S rRNA U516 pseudouridylate synthase RsuA-like enzyme
VRLIRKRFGPFNLGKLKLGNSKKLKLEDYSVLKTHWT